MSDEHVEGIERVTGPDGEVLYLLEYEITEGALEETRVGLTPEVEAVYAELYELTLDKPADAVARLEPLVAKYPSIPVLKNWLMVAYSEVGREAESDAMGERLWQEHSDYLFARVHRAAQLLAAGEVDGVPEVFGGTLDLKMMYPHRNVFHVSEAMALWSVAGEYALCKGNFHAAELYLAQMREFAPAHPMTKRLENLLLLDVVKRSILGLAKRRPRPRKPRTKAKGRPSDPARATAKKPARRKHKPPADTA